MTNKKDVAISIENLTKKFGNFTAVDHISLQVYKGEIFGFLGANGAGKTTAMRMLCGLSYPTSGYGTVAGYDRKSDCMGKPESFCYHLWHVCKKYQRKNRCRVQDFEDGTHAKCFS